jgi:hypothetical protein
MYVTGLLQGLIPDLLQLWDQFKERFCEDLLRKLQQPGAQFPLPLLLPQCDYGLYVIETLLQETRKSLADVSLPYYTFN